ncbi:uncharacterized protein SPPG_00977 [Spizellomyces punctatus DAOM BR117]|uniref:DUF1308 domain-containing protein n=1 Tax=Spizellomyces punctatus (strain DAOM BR117) TaxID=645134 RepID=A0A0L0HQZ7_SPIPD|nr:uncharacterized protein SPPG_00977 [Spizellomyces punctatus DAOM BR117]KND03493.1 hypothetical protein SPPG_00977 [Spizellomyces punctatus DAOM BR117]|eukprot:XP_016611532.1 hypothetical protein SPPG_00977 [Spizellomyces punctatus DAOM BR117]
MPTSQNLDPQSAHDVLFRQACALHARSQSLLADIDEIISQADTVGATARSTLAGGLHKLRSVTRAENKFLEKLVSTPTSIRPAHTSCSNIPYLSAVFRLVRTEPGVTHVFHTFNYAHEPGGPRRESIRVDIVAQKGQQWIKVKASALKGFQNDLCDEEEEESEEEENSTPSSNDDSNKTLQANGRTVLDGFSPPTLPIYQQAKRLLMAAEQNSLHYQTPTVVMKFVGKEEVDMRVQDTLRSMGILVEIHGDNANIDPKELGKTYNDSQIRNGPPDPSSTNRGPPSFNNEASVSRLQTDATLHPGIADTLNLDVTTLIALVTDITHRLDTIPVAAFDIPSLQLQASQETRRPLLPTLRDMFHTRYLVTTSTALRKFVDILKVLGGPTEQLRAKNLIIPGELATDVMAELEDYGSNTAAEDDASDVRVHVIEDSASERFVHLVGARGTTGKIQKHHVAVFGTGDRLRATTVTANAWVERTLLDAGLGELSLWIHEPRSLVELRVKKYRETECGEATEPTAT